MDGFTTKESSRFRKLLEVANSSTFTGERDAALAAATRLAATHGMTLREAAGMSEADEPAPRPQARTRPSGFRPDVGAAMRAAGLNRKSRAGVYNRFGARAPATSDANHLEAEKLRYDAAMADAFNRGLDAAERAAAAKARTFVRRPNKHAFRNRAEFIRVLLTETGMSAREIATTAGVTIYDVFREKLLLRHKAVAG